MPGFKRVPLEGSDELFRSTRQPAAARDQAGPPEEMLRLALTRSEIEAMIEAVQAARYPERQRPRPTIPDFERLGELREKLRRLISPE